MSSRRGLIVGVAVSVLAAVWLVASADIGAVAGTLGAVQVVWLIPALLILVGQAGVRAVRWAFLIRTVSNMPIGAARVVDAMLVGYFVNAVLPGRLGEAARTIVVARREALALGLVAATVVVERAADLMVLLLIASIALALTGSAWAPWFAAAGAAIAILLLLGPRARVLGRLIPRRTPPRLAGALQTFLASVGAVRPSALLRVSALAAVAWAADAALVLVAGRAVGVEISPAAAAAIALGGALGTALPAAPGYLATYELGAVALGSLAGVPKEAILPIAILAHLVGVTALALVGALALGRVSGIVRLDQLSRPAEMATVSRE